MLNEMTIISERNSELTAYGKRHDKTVANIRPQKFVTYNFPSSRKKSSFVQQSGYM